MRPLILFVALVFASASIGVASAQQLAPEQKKPSLSDLHSILIGRYQAIAGAWFIEQNCKFLEPEQRVSFEKYVGALNAYAQHKALVPTDQLLQMQKDGKMASELPTYSVCKEDSENLVRPTFMLTEMLYQDLIVAQQ